MGAENSRRGLEPPAIFAYVDAVARYGSIRKAADALHIASSALNRRILDLEDELGVKLFERLPRGVRATAAGELFLAYVRRSLKELRLVEAEIEALKGLVRGEVRIAVAESVTGRMLPDAIQTYQRQHPAIGFCVTVQRSSSSTCKLLMIGGYIAPIIRKITPRAALLGTLAGVSVAFISMRPAMEMYMTPVIGVTCFAIVLVSWFGKVRYFKGIPAGLVAIGVGVLIAWGSTAIGAPYGGMSGEALSKSLADFGFSLPIPAIGHTFHGFEFLGVILVTAIPFGIYDLVEAMDNVESAAAAGDEFPTHRVLTADGVISAIGCLMGNPFNLAVYIGHPGWKSMGGRIGYSAATGLMVIVLAWCGIISVMMALIPVVAIAPILLYIGMLIGAQAFQETPKKHAPAIILALTPHVAAWGKAQIDGSLGAAGTSAAEVGMDKLGQVGVLYEGLSVLGGGAIIAGLVLGAIGVFVIDRKFYKAAPFSFAGAVLTFFGFMHGEAIGFAASPGVALGYGMVTVWLLGCARFATAEDPEAAQLVAAESSETQLQPAE